MHHRGVTPLSCLRAGPVEVTILGLLPQMLQPYYLSLADGLQHAAQAREVLQDEARQLLFILKDCHLDKLEDSRLCWTD